MVSVTRAEQGFANFLDKEMLAKLPDGGLQKTAIGVLSALALRRGETVMNGLRDNKMVKALGIFDEEGNIDIDVLREVVKDNIPENGLKIDMPIIGKMTIFKEDIDSLHRHIMEVGE